MRRTFKWIWRVLLLVILIGVGLWLFGPREKVEPQTFDEAALPADPAALDAWLAAQEAKLPDITPGVQKRIVWAGEKGARTPLAIVYLHGFSATSEEIRPVPDIVAQRLGANLYFARLAGHGRPGAALGEVTAGDWLRDLAEALAIARRIGDRVAIISTSTGGTLAAIAATDPALSKDLAGVVFISPNFGIHDTTAEKILRAPFARILAPMVAGAEYSWTPRNEDHGRYWTTRYPTVALVAMQALVDHALARDFAAARVPALFIYSPDDQVVNPARTDEVVAAWGGPKEVLHPALTEADDPGAHVIMGRITSPNQVGWGAAVIEKFLRGL